MSVVRPTALLALALASGCSSCSNPPDGDASPDAELDADADRDVDAEQDADPDRTGAELDADEDARDTDSPFDANCAGELGDGGVRMDIVDVTTTYRGRECGPGCRQVSFAAPVDDHVLYAVDERFLVYIGDTEYYGAFLYDLTDAKEYELDNGPDHFRTLPGIDGVLSVYATGDWNPSELDMTLWRYSIGECGRYPLVTRTMTERARPMGGFSISGDMVAWRDSAIPAAGLYAMSLSGGEVIELTPEHCLCYGAPFLSGRTVVFEGSQTGPTNIWAVDLDTREQSNLTNADFDQFEPDSDGEWVVWTDSRDDPSPSPYSNRVNPDIYGMALLGREEQAICTDPSTQLHPAVGSGLVAWEDFRNAENPNDAWSHDANIDIYLYDLSTRREVQVTSEPGQERWPQVDGRRVFYLADDSDGEPAVFMVDLDEAGLL